MGKEEKPKSEEEKDKSSESPEQPEDIVPTEEESGLPIEILDKLDPEERKIVRRTFSMFMAGSFTSPHHYLFRKMTSEHIGKVLDGVERDNQREHQGRMSNRRWNYAYLITCLIFILAISGLFLWKDKSEYNSSYYRSTLRFRRRLWHWSESGTKAGSVIHILRVISTYG